MALVGPIRIRVQSKPRIRMRVLPRLIPLDATVEVGLVTTGAPGSPATVTNVGSPGAVVLDFSIPAGDQGADGLLQSVVAGTNVSVNSADPANPIVSVSGFGTAATKNTGTSAGSVPLLDGGGLLDTSILPSIAITDIFTVASQAAMLALTAQKGDVAIRTDLNKSYALSTNSPTTLVDWKELLTPTDAVLSVAGLTGAISGSSLKTALTLVKGDVGLGNVDNTSDATKNSATVTLTNKRITARLGTTASSATPTPDADANDVYTVTALAANATFGVPTGTPTDGQKLIIRIKDNGTARTLSFNAIYRAGTDVALPTTTVLSKTMYLGFVYNSADTKWDLVAKVNNI